MRMRKKKNFDRRWQAAASSILTADPASRKGVWQGDHSALRLELGCGKGLYLSRQAALAPDMLHIGIERSQSAALMAMEQAARDGLSNLTIICGDADNISNWFAPGELDRIDVLFCDPWPEARRAKRRLTHRHYLEIYKTLLDSNGIFCLRTDNEALFDYSLLELEAAGFQPLSVTRDLHGESAEPGESMTGYEEKFAALGQPIYQVKCKISEPNNS